jgi:hypothetical protein
MGKWIVVAVLLLAAAVAWKETRPGGAVPLQLDGRLVNTLPEASPLYAQQQEFIDRFNADPALRERFAGTFTSKGLFAEMNRALARGAQSLDGPSLVKVTRAMSAVIPRLPQHSCAKLMRPRDDFDHALGADIEDALQRLPAVHHRAVWDFYLRALKAEIDGLPVRPVDVAARERAMAELGSVYQGRFAERLLGVVRDPVAAPDEDACWAVGTLTHNATLLSPDSAHAMSRFIWARGQ